MSDKEHGAFPKSPSSTVMPAVDLCTGDLRRETLSPCGDNDFLSAAASSFLGSLETVCGFSTAGESTFGGRDEEGLPNML